MKPRLKSGLPVYFLEDGSARIGAQHEFTQQIADKKGNLRVLFEYLDGSLSSKEIVDSISNILGIPASEAENALTFLNNAGVLEDAEIYEDILPSLQVNHRFFQIVSPDLQSPITHAQKTLSSKTVSLLGMGGGGAAIFASLCRMGFKELRICDYDIVDESNLNRQLIFKKSDVGRKKVEVAKEFAADLNDTKIVSFDLKLSSEKDIVDVIKGSDLVICAVDEPPFVIQHLINTCCVKLNMPYICCLSQHTKGRFFTVIPHQSGCMGCLEFMYLEQDPQFFEQLKAILHPFQPQQTAVISPHIMLLASLISDEAIRTLTGYAPARAVGKQIDVDYLTGELTEVVSWTRNDTCPICSDTTSEKLPEVFLLLDKEILA